MILYLCAVPVFIYGVIWFIRYFNQPRRSPSLPRQTITPPPASEGLEEL